VRLRDLINSFDGPGDLEHKVNGAFSHLAVPRKERERVVLLLGMWLKLSSADPSTLKPGPIKRFSLLNELLMFCTALESTRDDAKVIRIIQAAISSRNSEYEDREHDPKPKHQRGRR